MKQLFTIACTLVLGSALSFAQTGSNSRLPPAGDDHDKTGTSTTTKSITIMARNPARKIRRPDTTTAPAANPALHPNKSLFSNQAASHEAAFFTPHGKRFLFPASLLKMLRNNSLQS